MSITKEVSPIAWKLSEPKEFPCSFCKNERAVKFVTLSIGEAPFKFVACGPCSQLAVTEIHNKIRADKGGMFC